jgi:acyl-CoA synthetase (AMP-forming)/AMP-acid ligase II
MSPLDFIKNPMAWLSACQRYRALTTGAPNFAYEYVLHRSTPAERKAVTNQYFVLVMTGGEPPRIPTLTRFCEAFPSYSLSLFTNCFGIAEAISYATGHRVTPECFLRIDRDTLQKRGSIVTVPDANQDAIKLMPVGNAMSEYFGGELGRTRFVIVDPETDEEQRDGTVGELLMSSPSLGSGYWGKSDDENDNLFRAKVKGRDGEAFLRTGDRGFIYKDWCT